MTKEEFENVREGLVKFKDRFYFIKTIDSGKGLLEIFDGNEEIWINYADVEDYRTSKEVKKSINKRFISTLLLLVFDAFLVIINVILKNYLCAILIVLCTIPITKDLLKIVEIKNFFTNLFNVIGSRD